MFLNDSFKFIGIDIEGVVKLLIRENLLKMRILFLFIRY